MVKKEGPPDIRPVDPASRELYGTHTSSRNRWRLEDAEKAWQLLSEGTPICFEMHTSRTSLRSRAATLIKMIERRDPSLRGRIKTFTRMVSGPGHYRCYMYVQEPAPDEGIPDM